MRNIKRKLFVAFLMGMIFGFMPNNLLAQEIHIAIIDSGANGYVDSAKSFTSFPANSDVLDHGTQIARLIRAKNPTATITMLQVCEKKDGELKPSRQAILRAIKWCVVHSIDIVNMSLVTKYDDAIEKAIVNASTSHGILFVAAAGNKSIASRFAADKNGFIRKVSKTVKPGFPASSPHVISVGAVDDYGQITSYSDKHCDVYADGKILGQEGTSFASARITAQVAQVVSNHQTATPKAVLSYLN